MNDIGSNDVVKFIANFKGSEDTFLYGCCFWFAFILCNRFDDAIMMYLPVENHFITKINNRMYDVRGDITDVYKDAPVYMWSEYCDIDSLAAERIIKYCIKKE